MTIRGLSKFVASLIVVILQYVVMHRSLSVHVLCNSEDKSNDKSFIAVS